MIELPFSHQDALTVVVPTEHHPPKPSWHEAIRNPMEQVGLDPDYQKNYTAAVEWVQAHVADYISSEEKFYSDFFPTVHRIMMEGSPKPSLKDRLFRRTRAVYTGQSPQMKDIVKPGEYRAELPISTRHNQRTLELARAFSVAYGDEFHSFLDSDKKVMKDSREHGTEKDQGYLQKEGSVTRYVYPSNELVKPAIEEFRRALAAADTKHTEEHIVMQLASAMYQVKYHPFSAVNNSVFHAIIQGYSRARGINVMPHMNLDLLSHLLKKDTFRRAYLWYYQNFAYKVTKAGKAEEEIIEKTQKASLFLHALQGKSPLDSALKAIPIS